MFLVVLHWFEQNKDTPCIVCLTEKLAQEWINKKMKGKTLNGSAVYQIKPIDVYPSKEEN